MPLDSSILESLGRTPAHVDVSAPATTEAQRSFLAVLGKHTSDQWVQTPEEKAREAAEKFVSMSLVQPLLKQLRSSNSAAPPFAPTPAEKQFRALMDADLAQRIVKAKQFPLIDTLAQRLLGSDGVAELEREAAQPSDARPSLGVNILAR